MATIKTMNSKGKYRDDNTKQNVASYILNPAKMPHLLYGMFGVNPANPDFSMYETAARFGKENGVQIRHYEVSYHPLELRDPVVADRIAAEFMNFIGRKYQVVYGVLENTAHLHFHIAFNSVSYIDGSRFYGTKTEHYELMNAIKVIVRKYGLYTSIMSGIICNRKTALSAKKNKQRRFRGCLSSSVFSCRYFDL